MPRTHETLVEVAFLKKFVGLSESSARIRERRQERHIIQKGPVARFLKSLTRLRRSLLMCELSLAPTKILLVG